MMYVRWLLVHRQYIAVHPPLITKKLTDAQAIGAHQFVHLIASSVLLNTSDDLDNHAITQSPTPTFPRWSIHRHQNVCEAAPEDFGRTPSAARPCHIPPLALSS